MKKIGILTPRGAIAPDAIVGTYLLLSQSNAYLIKQNQKPIFDIELVGYQEEVTLCNGLLSVKQQRYYAEAGRFDLLIIPGFLGGDDSLVADNQELITWMKAQYQSHQTQLASFCTGAFLIAATGLLDAKKCTTHWAFEQEFRMLFPSIDLMPEQIVIEDSGIYTSAGAYSSLNLVLYLIEKFTTKEVAVWLSKIFQIDINRHSQCAFMIFNQQKYHQDHAIIEVQDYIENHFQESLAVSELAERFAFSKRNFIRRFKKATGNTPIAYIQRVRIEQAKRLLQFSKQSIGEIVFATGYQDEKAFRELFKKYTGLLPSSYRSKYA